MHVVDGEKAANPGVKGGVNVDLDVSNRLVGLLDEFF